MKQRQNQKEKVYRYRTETFRGFQKYNPAEVMNYETFELQNADIPMHLSNTILKNNPISKTLRKIMQYLYGESEFLPVDLNNEEQCLKFWNEVVTEIEKETQTSLNFVLWLADIDAVTNEDFYGKYVETEDDIDTYEIGSIVLAELGYDGTLYGYSEKPKPLAKNNCISIVKA